MSELEQAWERFIEELNRVQPLEKGKTPHVSFLGSIAAYKKIFMKANQQHDVHPDPS